MANLAIVAAVLVAIVVVGLAIWLVPRRQVQRWRRAGISSEEKLAELGVQARSNVTQALGGLALIVTLAITGYQANESRRSAERTQLNADKNLSLARQSQVSERFSRAVEQLGAANKNETPAIDVRTGALFSLMRIALDYPETHAQPALLVVAAYVTNNYEVPKAQRPHGCRNARFGTQRRDVATALRFVLYRIAAKLHKQDLFGLRGADLSGFALDGLILNRFNLTGVKFTDAYLVRAHFHNATLSSTNFDRACLNGADFTGASVQGASFDGAELKGARFTRADLGRAHLSKAQRQVIVKSP
jgi:hypothetical protein